MNLRLVMALNLGLALVLIFGGSTRGDEPNESDSLRSEVRTLKDLIRRLDDRLEAIEARLSRIETVTGTVKTVPIPARFHREDSRQVPDHIERGSQFDAIHPWRLKSMHDPIRGIDKPRQEEIDRLFDRVPKQPRR